MNKEKQTIMDTDPEDNRVKKLDLGYDCGRT